MNNPAAQKGMVNSSERSEHQHEKAVASTVSKEADEEEPRDGEENHGARPLGVDCRIKLLRPRDALVRAQLGIQAFLEFRDEERTGRRQGRHSARA